MSNVNLLSASDVLIKEADELLEKGDTVQASEKYYKAAEEAIKLITKTLNIQDVLQKVKSLGRWSSTLLFEGAMSISPEMYSIWSDAWYLHIYGFHEMKLTYNEVKSASHNIHKIINILSDLIK